MKNLFSKDLKRFIIYVYVFSFIYLILNYSSKYDQVYLSSILEKFSNIDGFIFLNWLGFILTFTSLLIGVICATFFENICNKRIKKVGVK